jgi:hypothetical protein
MRTLPEQEAIDIFRRTRARGDVGAILSHVRDGDLLLQMHLAPETRLRYELPYTRNMPELLQASKSPYLDTMIYETASQSGLNSKLYKTRPEQRVFPEGYTSSLDQDLYFKPYHAAV